VLTDHERRLSITKLQRKSAAGADLISLLQEITEDGTLSDFEILSLEAWLAEHEDSHLPARDYLLSVLRDCAEDGVISSQERVQIYHAVETILPPDVRATARRARIAMQRHEHAAAIAAKRRARDEAIALAHAARDAAREARLRARPLNTFDFIVAGVVYERRDAIVNKFCSGGDAVYLARDCNNAFSKNAVEVRIGNGMQIGYVPEAFARGVAPALDSGCWYRAYIKKIIFGVRAPLPVVVAALYRSDCGVPGVLRESEAPLKRTLDAGNA